MLAIDSLIAATCLQGGLDLVTRNESDFAHTGVTVINPSWSYTNRAGFGWYGMSWCTAKIIGLGSQ
jgi:hypothetical protein